MTAGSLFILTQDFVMGQKSKNLQSLSKSKGLTAERYGNLLCFESNLNLRGNTNTIYFSDYFHFLCYFSVASLSLPHHRWASISVTTNGRGSDPHVRLLICRWWLECLWLMTYFLRYLVEAKIMQVFEWVLNKKNNKKMRKAEFS